MKLKTSNLTGHALDWAVASTEGYTNLRFHREPPLIGAWIMDPPRKMYGPVLLADISASTDWSQGGPIVERERIGLDFYEDGSYEDGGAWGAVTHEGTVHALGPTPLIAAMRCYVASKLGDVVDVPEELLA